MKINHLSVPTWNKSNVNDAEVLFDKISPFEPIIDSPSGVSIEALKESCEIQTGCGEELSQALEKVLPKLVFTVYKKCTSALRLDYNFKNSTSGSRIKIHALPNSELEVVMNFSSSESGTGIVQLEIVADENSKINLVQIVDAGAKFLLVSDVGARISSHANVKLTQVYLNGAKMYGGAFAELVGESAKFDCNAGYNLKKSELLDLNLVAIHRGKKSVSDIRVRGTLSNKSEKIYRGTIDFKTGASGSKGAESEEALLLDDTVINKAVPLILCTEDDVEGAHGASIGRLDEKIEYYLRSRGLSDKQIRKLMTKAKIFETVKNVRDKIALDKIRELIN